MARSTYRVSVLLAEKLTQEQRDDFMGFCRVNPGSTAIQRYLAELSGETVSVAAVQRWRDATFPSGKQAELFSQMAREFQGMDVTIAKEWLLGRSATLLSELHAKVDEGLLEEAAPEQLIVLLGNLTREVKSIADTVSKERYIKDKFELEMAGAHRLADLIESVFKDTSMETAIRNAIKAGLEQIESESAK